MRKLKPGVGKDRPVATSDVVDPLLKVNSVYLILLGFGFYFLK